MTNDLLKNLIRHWQNHMSLRTLKRLPRTCTWLDVLSVRKELTVYNGKKCLLPAGCWLTASLLLGRPPTSFEVPTDFIKKEFFYKFANCNELIPFVKFNFAPMIKNLFVHDYLSRRFERNKGGREVEGRLLGRCHFDVEDGCNALRRLHRCTEDSARVENESF